MTVVASRYELGERLGGGAAADVYRAYDHTLERDVALKLLRPAFAEVPELLDRFDRESQTIASIEHRNVVAVTDHGRLDGAPYLAMELVDGPTLQQLIRARGRLSESEVRDIGAQIASALEAAHTRGVIHRDLKPANILIATNGTVKVSDFGIAHLEASTQLTRTGEVLGTPRYVAPEQITGRVDARSDLYALGVVLYELATGRPPFDGETSFEIVRKQLRERPVPPRALVPGMTRELERVILRALEKDPARRFASAVAMRAALQPPVSSAVPVIAMRRPVPAAPSRVFSPFALTIAGVLALASVAAARFGDVAGVFATASAAPVVAASTAPMPTAPADTPAPATATVAPATPDPTVEPTPAPTVAPATRAPAPTVDAKAVITAADPRATIASFYALVNAKRYDEAATLWSARMRAAYPPATNIYGRFDRTSAISVRGSTVTAVSDTTARVSVDIIEVMLDGTVRHWVGEWGLLRAGSSWVMDSPSLRAA